MSIFSKLKNMGRQAVDNAEEAMADYERDAKYAIKDAAEEIASFESKIAQLNAQTKRMRRELATKQEKSEELLEIAKTFKANNNMNAAKSALGEKNNFDSVIADLTRQVSENDAIYKQLVDQRDVHQKKVNKAKSQLSTLAARNDAAKMRESLAKVSAGHGASSALSALDELEKQVIESETEAEAYEDLAPSNDYESLKEQADALKSSDNLEDQLAAL